MYSVSGGYYMDSSTFSQGKPKRVNKVHRSRKVHLIFFIALFISTFLFGAIVHAYSTSEDIQVQLKFEPTPVYETHIVDRGQSLWTIAKMYLPDNKDIRKYIYDIKSLNHLKTSILQEGQSLLLPNPQ